MESQEDIQVNQQGPKTWPKVAIIVLNWNGWRDTMLRFMEVRKNFLTFLHNTKLWEIG